MTSSAPALVSSNSSVADTLVGEGGRDGEDSMKTDGSNKTNGLLVPSKEKAHSGKLRPSMIARDYDFDDRRLDWRVED